MNGTPGEYLRNIENQAQDMFSQLVTKLVKEKGISEQLKAENQMERIGRMNNIRISSIRC